MLSVQLVHGQSVVAVGREERGVLTISYGFDETMLAQGGVNVCCNLLATKTGADH